MVVEDAGALEAAAACCLRFAARVPPLGAATAGGSWGCCSGGPLLGGAVSPSGGWGCCPACC
eukprot:566667-Pelagomonas_calceolata.AAC.2